MAAREGGWFRPSRSFVERVPKPGCSASLEAFLSPGMADTSSWLEQLHCTQPSKSLSLGGV